MSVGPWFETRQAHRDLGSHEGTRIPPWVRCAGEAQKGHRGVRMGVSATEPPKRLVESRVRGRGIPLGPGSPGGKGAGRGGGRAADACAGNPLSYFKDVITELRLLPAAVSR